MNPKTPYLSRLLFLTLALLVPLFFSPSGPFSFHYLDLLAPILLISLWKDWGFQKLLLRTFFIFTSSLIAYYTFHEVAQITGLLFGIGIPLILYALQFFKYSYQLFRQKPYQKLLLISLSSWLLFAFAFPPLPLGSLSWVLFAPWFFALDRLSRKEGATITFWSAVPFNGIMLYWIYNVAKVGPAVAIFGGLFLLIAYLSSFNVAVAWIYQSLKPKERLILFPLFWAGIEVLRTKGEISFPWLHAGYTLGDQLPTIQSSAYIGVFGLSALLIFCNLLFYKLWQEKKLARAPLLILFPLALHVFGSHTLQNAVLSQEKARVAIMQPNVLQANKWGLENFPKVLQKNWAHLSPLELRDSIDIIAFPETAIPNFRTRVPSEMTKLHNKARQLEADLLIGVLDTEAKGPPPRNRSYYNSARLLPHDNRPEQSYYKVFLVPFSERLPFDNILPIINYLNFGEGDFTPGSEVPIYKTSGFSWSPNICYETIYPYFVRQQINDGSKLIVNITNDAWFGLSTEPYQHLNLARFRAVENGIPIARSTNTGVSAAIDEFGRYIAKSEWYKDTVLIADIPIKTRDTFYSRWGGLLEIILFWFFIFGVSALIFFTRKNNSLPSTLKNAP